MCVKATRLSALDELLTRSPRSLVPPQSPPRMSQTTTTTTTTTTSFFDFLSFHRQYTYHCEARNGLRFICLSVAQFRLKLAYSFLEEVQRQFNGQYGDRAMSANAYQFNQFSDTLLGLMKKWNDPSVDRVQQVQDQIADVKGVMVANIESILERGDKLDMMVNKAENLAESSLGFKQGARKANCMMKKKNIIITAAIVASIVFILVVIFIILLITICGKVDCTPKKTDDTKKLLLRLLRL